MKSYFSGNCCFTLCESKTFIQSMVMIDDAPATLAILKNVLKVTAEEVNRFLHLSLNSPTDVVLLREPYVVAEMRLVCLLGYSEAKQRENEEKRAA